MRSANAQVIMTATPRQVVGGETVQVTWGVTEGTADFHDWLGLFVENDPKKCLRHVYVKTNKVSSQPICHPWWQTRPATTCREPPWQRACVFCCAGLATGSSCGSCASRTVLRVRCVCTRARARHDARAHSTQTLCADTVYARVSACVRALETGAHARAHTHTHTHSVAGSGL